MTQKLRWIAAAGGLLAVTLHAAPAHAVQFSLPTQVPFADAPRDVVLVDLNDDGVQDLVAATSEGLIVRRGTTAPGREPVTYAEPQRFDTDNGTVAVDAADLDGDRRPEIVAASQNGVPGGSVIILRNRSAKGQAIDLFRDPQKVYGDTRADSIAVLDGDSEGFPDDIAYTNAATGLLYVLLNKTVNVQSTGIVFTEPGLGFPAGADPVAVTGGDVTGDRISDFVVANRTPGTVSVLENTTPQNAATPSVRDTDRIPGVPGASSVVTSDLGGAAADRPEVVAGGLDGFHVLENTSPGTTTPRTYRNVNVPAGAIDDVVVAEVDEARDPATNASFGKDLVGLRAQDGDLTVAVDNGAGYAAAATFDASNQATPSTPIGLALGDANADGDPDVAVADGINDVAVLLRAPEVRPGPGGLPVVWREGEAPVAVDPGLTVTSPGDEVLEGATVRLGGTAAGDRLQVPAREGIASAYDAASRTLTLTGTDTAAAYQALLRQVTFSNTTDDPTSERRTAGFSVSDGVRSPEAVRGVDVVPVNDAPQVALSGPRGLFAPDKALYALDPGIAVGDPDTRALTSARITITRGFRAGADRLHFPQRNGFDSTTDAERGELVIRGNQSLAAWQDALRSVAFQTVGSAGDAREITIVVSDGTDTSAPVTRVLGPPLPADAGTATSAGTGSGAAAARQQGRQAGTAGSSLPRTFGITGRALRDGRIRLTVRAPRAGRLDVERLVARRRTQLSASRTALRAGTTTITLRPTSVVRRLVRDRGRAVLALRVAYRPQAGAVVRRVVRVAVGRVVITRTQALADGTVRLTVKAPFAGRLSIARARAGRTTTLAATTVRVRRGTTLVVVRPTPGAQRLVRRDGRLRLTLRATYRPTGRPASSESTAVTLRRR